MDDKPITVPVKEDAGGDAAGEAAQDTAGEAVAARSVTAGHDSFWLRLIGAGKVLKALFLLLIAVSVLRLVHTGFGDEMASISDLMRYSPESNVAHWILDKASLLTDRRLEQVSLGATVYALTEFIESYGLLRRRMWGEFLTFGLTVLFLPVDFYEMAVHFTWLKMGFTIANGLVAWYLGWHIERKRQMRRSLAVSGAAGV